MKYGVTIGAKDGKLNNTVFADMHELRLTLLRFQVPWKLVEPSKGNYNWSFWDNAVERSNEEGIDLCLTIKQPPAFWLVNGFPSPQGTLLIAKEMAARYKGKLLVMNIANEDFDNDSGIHFAELAAVMKEVYGPVKQIDPDLSIWPGALLQRNLDKQRQKLMQLWQGAAGCFDAISVHPYTGIPDPPRLDPADESLGNIPGFRRCIEQIKAINASFGHPNKPIVVDEIGWSITNQNHKASLVVSEEKQWQYLRYCYQTGKELGVSTMCIFTLGYAQPRPDGMAINQGSRIASTGLKQLIANDTDNPDPGEEPGEEDPDPTGPTPEQLARVLAHLTQADEAMKAARALLSSKRNG